MELLSRYPRLAGLSLDAKPIAILEVHPKTVLVNWGTPCPGVPSVPAGGIPVLRIAPAVPATTDGIIGRHVQRVATDRLLMMVRRQVADLRRRAATRADGAQRTWAAL